MYYKVIETIGNYVYLPKFDTKEEAQQLIDSLKKMDSVSKIKIQSNYQIVEGYKIEGRKYQIKIEISSENIELFEKLLSNAVITSNSVLLEKERKCIDKSYYPETWDYMEHVLHLSDKDIKENELIEFDNIDIARNCIHNIKDYVIHKTHKDRVLLEKIKKEDV